MRAVIPYKKENAKSRLSTVMTREQRETFVEKMLLDVVATLRKGGIQNIDIITTNACDVKKEVKANIIEDHTDLNDCLNKYLAQKEEPILIIMADLPLVKSGHIEDIVAGKADVTIVPGKGGGTNILFIRKPAYFRVKYYGSSFENHCMIAAQKNLSIRVYDSFLASTDIDEPQDITELLLHGHGIAKDYAEKRFGKKEGKGRVKISPFNEIPTS